MYETFIYERKPQLLPGTLPVVGKVLRARKKCTKVSEECRKLDKDKRELGISWLRNCFSISGNFSTLKWKMLESHHEG